MLFRITISNQIFFKIILFGILLHAVTTLSAQVRLDTDSAFQQARTLAFSGKRAEARVILRKILEVNPRSAEVQTLLGRTYSWDKKYDSARLELKQALSYAEKNEDATNALIDAELYSRNYPAALDIADNALKEINPRSEEFLLKKALALSNLQKYKEAYTTLQQLFKINPKNTKAISLAVTVVREIRINKIGVSYDHDEFSSDFSPWQGVSAFYSRKSKYFGSVIGRINYANRFDITGVQYELDMYPKLTKKMYAYFNAGYSKDDIFPDYRFGLSLYRSLPKSFEAEIGIRYLKYANSTIIYTGSLSKYVSNFWFSVRPALIPESLGTSRSVALISRYYLKGDADNYLTVTLGTGVAPDQYSRDLNLVKNPYVGSSSARLGFQHRFLSRFLFSTGLGYRKDEFRKGLFRENFNFNTGLEMFF